MPPARSPRSPRRPHPLVVLAAAYLAGSVPFSNLLARRRGVDLRRVGSRTVSGTSLYRVAGFGPLAVAGLADIAKGTVGPLLAGRDRPVLAAVAGGAGVAGHNWSPMLGGAGGRGISPAIGALGAQGPEGPAVLFAGLTAGRLARQTGLGSFVSFLALVPVLRWRRGRAGSVAATAVVVPLLAKRLLGNEAPVLPVFSTYLARLVLDRDSWSRDTVASSPGEAAGA